MGSDASRRQAMVSAAEPVRRPYKVLLKPPPVIVEPVAAREIGAVASVPAAPARKRATLEERLACMGCLDRADWRCWRDFCSLQLSNGPARPRRPEYPPRTPGCSLYHGREAGRAGTRSRPASFHPANTSGALMLLARSRRRTVTAAFVPLRYFCHRPPRLSCSASWPGDIALCCCMARAAGLGGRRLRHAGPSDEPRTTVLISIRRCHGGSPSRWDDAALAMVCGQTATAMGVLGTWPSAEPDDIAGISGAHRRRQVASAARSCPG